MNKPRLSGIAVPDGPDACRALRENEHRFRQVFYESAVGMALAGKDFHFAAVNRAFCSLTGYSEEELQSMSFPDITYPADIPADKAAAARLIRGELAEYATEKRYVRKDGAVIWASLVASVFRDADGAFQYLFGVIVDITERKKAEIRLAESERRYRALTASLPGLAYRCRGDAAWTMEYASEGARALTGYAPEELVGGASVGCGGLIVPEDEPAARQAVREALSAGSHFAIRYRIRARDGTVKWVWDQGRGVYGDGGRLLAFEGFIIDISERKNFETALQRSEAKLRAILDETPVAINITDPAGKVEYLNAQFLRLFGYSPDDIPDLDHWFRLAYPDPDYRAWVITNRNEAAARAVREGADASPRELAITCRDGSTRFVSAAIARAADRTITIFHDISARKLAEESLRESNRKLEKSLDSTIGAISMIIEARDPFTAGHQKRAAQLAVALAKEMGMAADHIQRIRVAALLHDVGKINIPGEILSKPGRLSDVEFRVVETYPQASYDILKMIDYSPAVARMVLQHQERFDGSGYPQGLAGSEIMPEARLLAVADAAEAMMAHRPYRRAMDREEVIAELAKQRGRLFDPEVVDACIRLFNEKRFSFDRTALDEALLSG